MNLYSSTEVSHRNTGGRTPQLPSPSGLLPDLHQPCKEHHYSYILVCSWRKICLHEFWVSLTWVLSYSYPE